MKYTTRPTKHVLWSACKNFVIILKEATNFFLIKKEEGKNPVERESRPKPPKAANRERNFPYIK
jgi:hypothetical protein